METDRPKFCVALRRLPSILGVTATFLALSLGGCTSSPKNTHPTDVSTGPYSESMGPPAPLGPSPAPEERIGSNYGPAPIELKPLVLVFGPGVARSFACAGVLRALHEAKIPVGAIVASDSGALIASMYALSESINRFEWALLRIKKEHFIGGGGLFSLSSGLSDGSGIEELVRATVGDKDLSEGRIPLRVIVHLQRQGKPVSIRSGSTARAVRAAVALPSLFQPVTISGERTVSAATSRPYAVSEAKALEIGPVVVVDLLADSPSVSSKGEQEVRVAEQMRIARQLGRRDLPEADLVLRPDLDEIGYLDFDQRTELAFRGKNIVKRNIEQLRHLVGLPPNGDLGEHGSASPLGAIE